MAFNFNWTPLTADLSFYERAQELLTAALNKYPKPPIIVDDILVTELNLGSVPPDLEILEVGDIAEDRFRGIFKMCYSGNAFMTLKTRVQANPLNTYLSTRPTFASPEPLAAAAGLTIPLKITLSNIKLSAFIILVFSKQKGLTLVFRNDPLESLKVSSTFDSIPFVRDYLQRTIESQLRTLLMDEAPAIIHRLSLRLWVPEYRVREEKELQRLNEMTADPLASPMEDTVDLDGQVIDARQISSLTIDPESQSFLSHKNLIRLATLSDSQRTLSLFTPIMQDVVYRAWSGSSERPGLFSPALSRTNSMINSPIYDAFSDDGSFSTRPTLHRFGSSFAGSSSGKSGRPRKRKHRIVNLRKPKVDDDGTGINSESGTISSSTSDAGFSAPTIEDREAELITPPLSPQVRRSSVHGVPSASLPELTPRPPKAERDTSDSFFSQQVPVYEETPRSSTYIERPKARLNRDLHSFVTPDEALNSKARNGRSSPGSSFFTAPFPLFDSNSGGILEQAWMMKIAGEIARRVQEQKMEHMASKHTEAQSTHGNVWSNMSEAPPAYGE